MLLTNILDTFYLKNNFIILFIQSDRGIKISFSINSTNVHEFTEFLKGIIPKIQGSINSSIIST